MNTNLKVNKFIDDSSLSDTDYTHQLSLVGDFEVRLPYFKS